MQEDAAWRRGLTRAEVLAVVAAAALVMAAVIPALRPAQGGAEVPALARCRGNLQKIGVGLLAYAQEYGGAMPVTDVVDGPHGGVIGALWPRYVSDGRVFYCPAETRAELSYSEQHMKAGAIGYFYYGAEKASGNENLSKFLLTGVEWPRELKCGMDNKMWVMSDIWMSGSATAHAGFRKGVNYLMLDGSVDFVGESPRQAFR